jgi:hypothetical protein
VDVGSWRSGNASPGRRLRQMDLRPARRSALLATARGKIAAVKGAAPSGISHRPAERGKRREAAPAPETSRQNWPARCQDRCRLREVDRVSRGSRYLLVKKALECATFENFWPDQQLHTPERGFPQDRRSGSGSSVLLVLQGPQERRAKLRRKS